MNVSIYKNAVDTAGGVRPIEKLLEAIIEGRWADKINELRSLSDEEYQEKKKMLPAFTACGVFDKREAAGILEYSGLIVIDLDKLSEEQITTYREAMSGDPYSYAWFMSPSGKGLKILFKVDSPAAYHKHAWREIKTYLEENYGMEVDSSGQDISRLCFVSYDPDGMQASEGYWQSFPIETEGINPDGEQNLQDRPTKFSGKSTSTSVNYIYQVCLKWTEGRFNYAPGERNSFIHALACNLNRCGVSQQDATFVCATNFRDLPYKEIGQAINSAYKHNVSQFATVDVYQVEQDGNSIEYPLAVGHSDDTIDEDFIQKTIQLLELRVPKRLLFNLMIAYGLSQNDISDKVYDEAALSALMKKASEQYKASVGSAEGALTYESIEDALMKGIEGFAGVAGVSTFVPEFDKALGGSLQKGCYYGFIGMGKSCKSLWAAYLAAENAKMMNVATLYINAEMSVMQFMDRLVGKELGIDLLLGLEAKEITTKTAQAMVKDMQERLGSNIFLHNGSGFTREMISDTKKAIEAKTGKVIGIIVIDGHSQAEDTKRDESKSAIYHAGQFKELAKEENVVVIDILHTSGSCYSHLRNQSDHVRGGMKVTANMDGFFSFSRCIDETMSTDEDIAYRNDMAYIRYVDKRGSGEVVNKVMSIHPHMKISPMHIDPRTVEVNLKK